MKFKKVQLCASALGSLLIGLTLPTMTATMASAASNKAPIVVGGVYQAADYSGLADGFNARISQFNKAGGIDGHMIRFLGVQDDGGSPTTDENIIQKLVEEDHVDVVGPIITDAFEPSSSAFLTQHKTPFLGWAVAPNWCNNTYAFSADGCLILTNGQTSLAIGASLAQYVKSLGKKPSNTPVAIVNIDIPTASGSGDYEAETFEAAGFKVVFNKGIIPANGAATNYTPYVEQILASNPGVVFLSLDFASSVALSAAFNAAGYKGILYSPVGYSEGLLQEEPSVRAALQGEVVNTEFPAAEDQSPATKGIEKALTAIGKTQPLGLGATVGYYDADMLIQMLQNAAKKEKPLTGAGIAAAANSGFTYKMTAKGGACAQTFPGAHAVGIVGTTLMQVQGAQYKLKVPYTCFANVKAPSSGSG
jgi:branched-chain amino acid transport system substrate-binding protein